MVLPLAKLGNLGEYRESDKKASAEQLEVTEKQQTLNYRAVNSFLATNGFNKENFEKTFDLDAAIKLVEAEKEDEGAKKMAGVLNGAKANFVKYKSLDVLKNSDQEAARTRIICISNANANLRGISWRRKKATATAATCIPKNRISRFLLPINPIVIYYHNTMSNIPIL